MDLSEFGLDDDDLSLFGAMADQTPVRGAGGQPASQPVGSEDSAVTASASGTVQTDVSSEELASALSSIDESGTSVEDQELHTPDEFERELDAMLASVKNDLPWPLQRK
nr:hypothetical protein BaRGS_024296 [Batillaria attramentaria]